MWSIRWMQLSAEFPPLSSWRTVRETEEMHGFNLSARLTNELGRKIAPVRPVVQPWAVVWLLTSATGWKKKKKTEMQKTPEIWPQKKWQRWRENWIFTAFIYWCHAGCYKMAANERGRGGDLRPDHHPNGAHLFGLHIIGMNQPPSRPQPHLPQERTQAPIYINEWMSIWTLRCEGRRLISPGEHKQRVCARS